MKFSLIITSFVILLALYYIMVSRSYIILFIHLVHLSLYAQQGNYEMGARSSALSHASATLTDPWSLFNNVGGLAFAEDRTLMFSHQNKYQLSELSTTAFGIVEPTNLGVFGLGIHRFGGDLLNEHRVNVAYGHRLGMVSMGVNVSYYQLFIFESGRSSAILFDFGGIVSLTKTLSFATHIANINQPKISSIPEQRVPVIMKAGINYSPHEDLSVLAEVKKNNSLAAQYSLAVEYWFVEYLVARTGISPQISYRSFGMGLDLSKYKMQLDYSFSTQIILGDVHQLSISRIFHD